MAAHSVIDSIFFYRMFYLDSLLFKFPDIERYVRIVVFILIFITGFVIIKFILKLNSLNLKLKESMEELKLVNQHLTADEQQLKASNQQLKAYNQQLISSEQQLRAAEQQQKAINQQLRTTEIELRNEIDNHIISRKQLEINERRYRMMFEQMTDAVAVYETLDSGKNFIFKDFNKSGELIEKIDRRFLIGKSVLEVFPAVKDFGLFEVFQRVYKTGVPEHFPVKLYKDLRLAGWRDNYIYKLPTGEIVAIYSDVTEKKNAEQYRLLNMKILQILNSDEDTCKIIESILNMIKKQVSLDEAEIIISEKNDYFYYLDSGCLTGFVRTGNCLMMTAAAKKIENKNCMAADCICGLVLAGKISEIPGVSTEYGSFFTSESSEIFLNKEKSEQISGIRFKYCSSEYESVAIIPLKIETGIIGVLQFVSKNRNRFDKDNISYLEGIAGSIVIALKRKSILDALKYNEQRLKFAFEAASEGMWDWDLIEKKIYFSPRFHSMLGYEFEGFSYDTDILFKYIHPEDRERARFNLKKYISSPLSEKFEQVFRMITKNGDLIWVMSRGKIFEWNKMKPSRMIGTYMDITQQMKIHNQLIHSEKLSAVGQLASGIAHEFNNILAIIKSFAQTVILNIEPNPDYLEIMKEIDVQVKRGAEIVGSIMAFAKPRELKKEICDIKKIIEHVIKIQKKSLEFENVKIITEFDYSSELYADVTRIEQVLVNMILNARHAIKAKKGGGIIKISVKEINDFIEILISDTGIGISEENLLSIFEPFYTTKGARGSEFNNETGTGLGLSICYSIIKSHNGSISVKSKINEGATFIISLPVKEPKILMDSENIENNGEILTVTDNKPDISEKLLKIIIIDDENLIADTLSMAIKKMMTSEIDCFYNGTSAIEAFRKKKYDIAFIDLLLPGIDGYKIAEEFLKIEPLIKIIFMSGQVRIEIGEIMGRSEFGFLQKPFDINDVMNTITLIKKK
ncbi:PAS domain-containing protein [Candidatus Dependentiae bacterium]|nr:PAS domain-containing protein [Candidatus Dependentiae bacterium]